jgi:hypothetical protein
MNTDNKNTELDDADKKLHISDVISSTKECCDNPQIEIYYENNSNIDGSGLMGVTHNIFKCKNCGNSWWQDYP